MCVMCRKMWVSVVCIEVLWEGCPFLVCVCFGEGELLGLVSRDLAVMR